MIYGILWAPEILIGEVRVELGQVYPGKIGLVMGVLRDHCLSTFHPLNCPSTFGQGRTECCVRQKILSWTPHPFCGFMKQFRVKTQQSWEEEIVFSPSFDGTGRMKSGGALPAASASYLLSNFVELEAVTILLLVAAYSKCIFLSPIL